MFATMQHEPEKGTTHVNGFPSSPRVVINFAALLTFEFLDLLFERGDLHRAACDTCRPRLTQEQARHDMNA